MRPARLVPAQRALAVVLVAHGSRDPRAARATEELAAAVRDLHPGWDVRAAYLDHSVPRPRQVLVSFDAAGHRRAVLVPLLLTSAYHGRVDVPGEIAAAQAEGVRLTVPLADVLGPVDGIVPPLLLDALCARLGDVSGLDALVLGAAGTRDAAARGTVELAAAALGERLGLPCRVAYASAAPPVAGDAVRRLREEGYERVGLASYFLAPGLLWDAAVASAGEAGVARVSSPMTDTAALAALVAQRVVAAAERRLVTAA